MPYAAGAILASITAANCRAGTRRYSFAYGESFTRAFQPNSAFRWQAELKGKPPKQLGVLASKDLAGHLGPLVESVLDTLAAPKTQEAYRTALRDFLAWTTEQRKRVSRSLLESWRADLLSRGLAPSSINQRLSAVRALLRYAADRGVLARDQAARIASTTNVQASGSGRGKLLSEKEAGKLLRAPDPQSLVGRRNRAMLALLLVCGMKREEIVRLEVGHMQRQEDRWVLAEFSGKGRRLHTVPVPLWVKTLLDSWLKRSGITEGPLFRVVRKGGNLGPAVPLSPDAVYTVVREAGAAIGHPDLTPQDLRRTCAHLCRQAGGELEQIQLLLGHASIQTTQRYLHAQQRLAPAVNDRLKIRVD